MQVACNDRQYIIRRHGLDAALATNLAAAVPLIERGRATEHGADGSSPPRAARGPGRAARPAERMC